MVFALCFFSVSLCAFAMADDTFPNTDVPLDEVTNGENTVENEPTSNEVADGETTVENESTSNEMADGENTVENTLTSDEVAGGENTVENTPETNEVTGDNEESENGFFPSLFSIYDRHKGEIFSLLSAVVSLVLVFVYQKGLLPVLKGGLTLIEGQVKGLREINSISKEESARVGEEALALARSMESATAEMRAMTEAVLNSSKSSGERDEEFSKMKKCILWQANLLGEVFLASSLPEFSKERVSEVIKEVRAMMRLSEEETK